MEEKTVQREDVLGEAIQILEIEGIANTTLEMVAERVAYPLNDLKRFWPDQEALLYDALRYLSHQVDAWRRQLLLGRVAQRGAEAAGPLRRADHLRKQPSLSRCLFIAACTFYPDPQHPIHQLAEQQKQASLAYTHELLSQLEVDDPAMVAKQMELIVEGCLSRLLIKRSQTDVDTARRLAEDILRFAQCRMGGALT
ncbi:putative transcriptional regulator [Klebsiella michiganensis]|nr:putative transcriptional regulator [Klebsiella michiganensis]